MASDPIVLRPEDAIAQAQTELQRARDELKDATERVQQRLERVNAWLGPVRKHPWLFLAGAFAAGALIAIALEGRNADDD